VQQDVIMKRTELEGLMAKENTAYVTARDNKTKKILTLSYKDVRLLIEDIDWVWAEGQKTDEEQEFEWHYMALRFFFPRKHKIYKVHLKTCISCFNKPQRIRIFSWLNTFLNEREFYKNKKI